MTKEKTMTYEMDWQDGTNGDAYALLVQGALTLVVVRSTDEDADHDAIGRFDTRHTAGAYDVRDAINERGAWWWTPDTAWSRLERYRDTVVQTSRATPLDVCREIAAAQFAHHRQGACDWMNGWWWYNQYVVQIARTCDRIDTRAGRSPCIDGACASLGMVESDTEDRAVRTIMHDLFADAQGAFRALHGAVYDADLAAIDAALRPSVDAHPPRHHDPTPTDYWTSADADAAPGPHQSAAPVGWAWNTHLDIQMTGYDDHDDAERVEASGLYGGVRFQVVCVEPGWNPDTAVTVRMPDGAEYTLMLDDCATNAVVEHRSTPGDTHWVFSMAVVPPGSDAQITVAHNWDAIARTISVTLPVSPSAPGAARREVDQRALGAYHAPIDAVIAEMTAELVADIWVDPDTRDRLRVDAVQVDGVWKGRINDGVTETVFSLEDRAEHERVVQGGA